MNRPQITALAVRRLRLDAVNCLDEENYYAGHKNSSNADVDRYMHFKHLYYEKMPGTLKKCNNCHEICRQYCSKHIQSTYR